MTLPIAFPRPVLLLPVLLALALSGRALAESPMELPSSPGEICPVLVGTEIPDALIQDLDGNEVSLHEAVGGKPTVLIFYRGGW